jgi:hypothetical protein
MEVDSGAGILFDLVVRWYDAVVAPGKNAVPSVMVDRSGFCAL